MTAGDLGEAVIPLAGVEQVGGEERVETAAGQVAARHTQGHSLPLEVVADLGHGRIAEQLGEKPHAGPVAGREHLRRDPSSHVG